MIIKLLIDGGDMKPGLVVVQQLGPMGINLGKVISDVNEATKEFKGMKVPVELDVDEKTKEFEVRTSSPPTSELLKKELGLDKGTADHKNVKMGNASIETIIKVTKVKYSNMLEKEFKSAVKSVLGTCSSIGILVENKEPNELIRDVEEGKFDKEINEKKTEADEDKKAKLKEYFDEIKSEQDTKLAEKKAEEEEKAAKADEEAAKAAPSEDAAEEKKEEEKK
jgi:large subunit ribosomal protein L11